jgi:hypothetical protein
MISKASALEVARPGDESDVLHAAQSRTNSRRSSTIWKVLFQMPTVTRLAASRGWRCAGCGSQVGDIERDAATVCVFCAAWVQWRRKGDEQWARVLRDQGYKDHSMPHPEFIGLAALA